MPRSLFLFVAATPLTKPRIYSNISFESRGGKLKGSLPCRRSMAYPIQTLRVIQIVNQATHSLIGG